MHFSLLPQLIALVPPDITSFVGRNKRKIKKKVGNKKMAVERKENDLPKLYE